MIAGLTCVSAVGHQKNKLSAKRLSRYVPSSRQSLIIVSCKLEGYIKDNGKQTKSGQDIF